MPCIRTLCAAAAVASAASARAPFPGAGVGADPSSGWLSYAVYNAPSATDVITRLSATMTVPDTPQGHLGSPAFWFGTQTTKGDGALIQPIMAKWLGNGFYMFHEIFDWTDENDEQSKQIKVLPGQVIRASVSLEGAERGGADGAGATLNASLGTYLMNMTRYGGAAATTTTTTFKYALLPRQTATESAAYFVLEHQPSSCRQLPPNGNVTWTDIQVEVNGKPVDSPVFKAVQENPKCGSKAEVVDPKTVRITWAA